MPTITQISLVYSAEPFMIIDYSEGGGAIQEEISYSEINSYIDRFTQQENIPGRFINFASGVYTVNNRQFPAILITSNDVGPTPPPGLATKNFIFVNLTPLPITEINSFSKPLFDPINGIGYNNFYPLTEGQQTRGNLQVTPADDTGVLDITTFGMGVPDTLHILCLGDDVRYQSYPINNGANQLFNYSYNVAYGGSLTIIVCVGDFPASYNPPPARTGVYRVDSNKPNYSVTATNSGVQELQTQGIVYPVSNGVQFGTWADQDPATMDRVSVDINATIPPAGNAYVTLYVNNIARDTQIVTNGLNTYTLLNLLPLLNGQEVRVAVYGD